MIENSNVNNELIFSLDIGTRTIIGIVGVKENENFRIIASDIIEHEKRAMYDGQIHDINSVTNVVRRVKESLESKVGTTLNKVCIAAAGRSLETCRTSTTIDVDITREIDIRTIRSAEMEAIQDTQEKLDKDLEKQDQRVRYYCVGYTVVNYYLDDVLIENLEGHRGSNITIDVLATFLPYTVVNSLHTVMDRVGLEVKNMTLEPMAAINVAIKKNLRLLNLALVDIGAGTSDIAITRDGSICAYAMASIAGDEITEKISKVFLLDYDVAEKLKIELNIKDIHEFEDIVGIKYEMTTEEILNKIDDTIRLLAKEISEKILELNEKSPSAIFLIGGGSQIPRLDDYIAEFLELQKERVVVRDTSIIENVEGITDNIKGSNAITPIGIATISMGDNYDNFIEVTVNNEKLKMFNTNSYRVMDALLLIGYNPRKLIAKRGEELIYYFNDERKVSIGEIGDPAKIYVNGEIKDLEYELKNRDIVKIEDAIKGSKPKIRIRDVVDMDKKLYVNEKEYNFIEKVIVNNRLVDGNYLIRDNDQVKVEQIITLEDLFNKLNLDINKYICYKDNIKINSSYILNKDDKIFYEKIDKGSNQREKERNNKSKEKTISLNVNGEKITISYKKNRLNFIDIFKYINFDLSKPKGSLVLRLNGLRAEYLQPLNEGDNIEIYWEK
ncbi:cell division protein FtsA [Gottschalkia purinilytica]|uniref:Chaperone protein DnaK n=1 Tax=Gottschalkia purinilytica TaxID=1503 RepID=A0A0L0WF86_GOTPU|nr:cell division FtsA domain-containing protein [Gottschalkia purinilytica]KNF10143.1 cell division protein FtsA [Gottschalkia purinilytica]